MRVTDSVRLVLAKRIVAEIRKREGRNLVAAAVYGSAAYGRERRHSDLDLIVLVRRARTIPKYRVHEGVLVSTSVCTPDEAREQITGANPDLPEVLSGWRSARPLHDPYAVLRRLIARAHRVPASQWRRSARAGLLATYEDFGKLRDAAEAEDLEKMREMAIWFTGGAAAVLLCLRQHTVPTGQEMFVEVRRIGELGRAIVRLRYRNLSINEAGRLADSIWAGLLRGASRQEVRVVDLR